MVFSLNLKLFKFSFILIWIIANHVIVYTISGSKLKIYTKTNNGFLLLKTSQFNIKFNEYVILFSISDIAQIKI